MRRRWARANRRMIYKGKGDSKLVSREEKRAAAGVAQLESYRDVKKVLPLAYR